MDSASYSAHQNIQPSTNGNFVDHDPPAYDTIAYNNNIESAHTGREHRRDTNSYRSDVGSAVGHVRVETNPYHTGYDQTGYDDAPPKYTELPVSVTYPHSPERRIITSQLQTVTTDPPVPMGVSRANQFPTAFCVFLCCFVPTGLAAVYFSIAAQKMLAIGNFEKAHFYQRMTRALILVSLGFGFLCWVAYGLLIYYRFIVATSPGSPYDF